MNLEKIATFRLTRWAKWKGYIEVVQAAQLLLVTPGTIEVIADKVPELTCWCDPYGTKLTYVVWSALEDVV